MSGPSNVADEILHKVPVEIDTQALLGTEKGARHGVQTAQLDAHPSSTRDESLVHGVEVRLDGLFRKSMINSEPKGHDVGVTNERIFIERGGKGGILEGT